MEKNNGIYEFENELKGYKLQTITCLEDLKLDDKDFSHQDYINFFNNEKSKTEIAISNNDKKTIIDFHGYFKLYEEIFNDNDEREPKEVIIKRILEKKDYSTLLNICRNSQNNVIGGFVIEYYEKSNCCILTYLFVSNEEREKGLGKALIHEGLRYVLQNNLKKVDKNGDIVNVIDVDAIFLETESPLYTFFLENDTVEVKNKEIDKRLKFFSEKIKAKWVDIPYIQPRLPKEADKPKKNKAFHLLLLTLPNITKKSNPFLLDKSIIIKFISEFYFVVEQEYRSTEENNSYKKCMEEIHYYCEQLKKTKEEKIKTKFVQIFNKTNKIDPYLARILLNIEVLDAIDDLDPGNTLTITKNSFSNSVSEDINDKVEIANKLRGLQLQIKASFNEVADEIRRLKKEKSKNDITYNDRAQLALEINDCITQDEISSRELLEEIFKSFNRIYLSQNFKDTNDDFYLREVPKFKTPNLNFSKTAISIHFIKQQDFSDTKTKSEKLQGGLEKIKAHLKSLSKTKHFTQKKEDKDNLYCPYFHSFEKDLFSLRYHNNSPYVSKVALEKPITIQIEFPNEVQFLSEGRQETIFINAEREAEFKNKVKKTANEDDKIHYDSYTIDIQCYLNFIYFKESGIRVWELVLNNFIKNDNGRVPFNEFEIIQISKFFTGKQERNLPSLRIISDYISDKDNSMFRVSELLECLKSLCVNQQQVNSNPYSNYSILCGTIQIDTKYINIYDEDENKFVKLFDDDEKVNLDKSNLNIKRRIDYLQESYLKDSINDEQLLRDLYGIKENKLNDKIFYSDLYSNINLSHEGQEQKDFERNYNDNVYLNTVLNFMCGVSLGIFDYERMSYPEVLDTLKPLKESATNDYMIILQRSSLICFCHDDSVFDTAWYTIGISPYLLIPNSVLAHNHYLAEERIDKLREYGLSEKILKKDKIIISNYLKTKYAKDFYSLKVQIRNGIEKIKEKNIIKEVFNYPTETEIYNYGMEYRTTNQYLNSSKESDEFLKSQIEEFRETRRGDFEFFMAAFLALIGIFQIKTVIRELFDLTMVNNHISKLTQFIFNRVPPVPPVSPPVNTQETNNEWTKYDESIKEWTNQIESVELFLIIILYGFLMYLLFLRRKILIKRKTS